MTSKISKYEVIHRGECVNYMPPGTWVFIQRALCYGGGSGSEEFTMSASGLSSKNPPRYLSE